MKETKDSRGLNEQLHRHLSPMCGRNFNFKKICKINAITTIKNQEFKNNLVSPSAILHPLNNLFHWISMAPHADKGTKVLITWAIHPPIFFVLPFIYWKNGQQLFENEKLRSTYLVNQKAKKIAKFRLVFSLRELLK